MPDDAEAAAARSDRWRPNRVGIRNIWEYDDQEFLFVDGRLILRGPNGSGKSNALALLVPFVFDAVMSSGRMDPFGGGRSMKTLLLSEQKEEGSGSHYRRDQRTGYVWMELVRGDRTLTIGCGARASKQRDAEAWFFVTDRRPGLDLDLVPDGTPATRSQLAESLGAGAVFDTAESYRAAVDRALFGVGADRYRHLVDLLLVLRRPHLAGKLQPEELSAVLTQGLPPVPATLVADVAASFEDLEAVRGDLSRLLEARRAVDEFCPVYRSYLRTVARYRADRMLEAVRSARGARNRLATATKAFETAEARLGDLEQARTESERRRDLAEERLRAVLESPAFRDAAALATLANQASDARGEAEKAAVRTGEARDARDRTTDAVGRATAELTAAEADVDRSYGEATLAADAAGVSWSARRDDLAGPDLGAALRSSATVRLDEITQVRGAVTTAAAASRRAEEAERRAGDSDREAEAAAGRRLEAEAALAAAVTALVGTLERWCADTEVVQPEEARILVDAAGQAGEPVSRSLAEVATGLFGPKRRDLGVELARLDDRLGEAAARRDELVAERDLVAADPLPAPDRLAVRPADRTDRPGAPLFACCDFRNGVGEEDRSGIEAALHAAGLLDAWVPADAGGAGTVPDGDELDAWLIPSRPVDGPSLADVLVADPSDDSGLDADRVGAVLRSIALAETGIGVLPDGRFSLGPLTGRYAKPAAEYIGTTAREARRQRRIAELDALVSEAEEALGSIGSRRAAVTERLAAVDAAEGSLPSTDDVARSRRHHDHAVAVSAERAAVAERERTVAVANQKEASLAVEALRTVGARFGLPTHPDGLDEIAAAVRTFERSAADLLRVAGQAALLAERVGEVTGQLVAAEEALAQRLAEQAAADRYADGLSERVAEVRRQLGPDADAPLRRRQEIESEVAQLKVAVSKATDDVLAHREELGTVRNQAASAREAVERADGTVEERKVTVAVLARPALWEAVAGHGDPAVADIGTSDETEGEAGGTAGLRAPDDPVERCRLVVSSVDDVDTGPDAVRNATNHLDTAYRVLMDNLRHGFEPSQVHDDDVGIVQVTSETGTISALQLARVLAAQVAQHEELLDERDQAIFERHLLTRVSETLRDLLNSAHELVDDINTCLRETPTASGLRVRLRWQLDQASTAQQDALELLRRSPELLGPDDRERLRRFFAGAIADERAANPGAGYEAVLTRVFDYRSWHSFVPFLVLPTGGSQQLTRTVFRSLSGGEQSVSLHLPLFAAAAAHYNAAGDGAPRLVALDEAFAGIDEGMRADLMGLLVRFDLDVVMTGHELWGAYGQVPGVMIYDLLRRPPAEGVSAMPMRWDGGTLTEEPMVSPSPQRSSAAELAG